MKESVRNQIEQLTEQTNWKCQIPPRTFFLPHRELGHRHLLLEWTHKSWKMKIKLQQLSNETSCQGNVVFIEKLPDQKNARPSQEFMMIMFKSSY